MAKGKNTVERVRELAQPIVDGLGLRLWDVRYEKEGASWFLRVIIDADRPVTTDDCEAVSRPLDKLLDEHDFIENSYYLEIASAGLGRQLLKPEHFLFCMGKEIRIKLIREKDGVRELEGVLTSFEDVMIVLSTLSEEKTIALSDTAYVKLSNDKDLY